MKRFIAVGTIAIVAAGAAAVPSMSATKTVTKTVAVKDNVFAPTRLTVRTGTTVRWLWRGKAPHNVTVTRGPVKFKSATITKGSFQRKLTRKGTYQILCTIHAPGMKMTVTVR